MAFARMFNNPNVTKEQYDAVRAKMGIGSENVPEGASSPTSPAKAQTAVGASSRSGSLKMTPAPGIRS